MLAAAGGALALAGCISAAPAPSAIAPSAPPPPAPVAAVEAPLPPHPPRKPASPQTLAALPPEGAPQEGTPSTAGSATDLSFAKLNGLDENETVAMLGQPQQRADSPPAVLWRYTSRDCELDVYFYLDLQSRDMRILHYEVRDTDGSDRSQQDCYAELVASRRTD
jgi:hypothetical protein